MKIVLAFLGLLYPAASADVTPVQKAVEMLEGMLENAKAAKHEENVQYAGFKQFCGDVTTSKQKSIEDADGQIELLKADIEKANSEADRLGEEVAGHGSDIDGWEKDQKDATSVRKTEKETYLETHMDYTESIQALENAIMVLKRQNFDRSSKSLLQKVSALTRIPEDARKAVQAFLDKTAIDREDPNPDQNLGYKATAYTFQSTDIITMLEKLKDQFRDELTKLQKDEVTRHHTYDTLSQDLTSQTTDAKNSIQEKTVTKANQAKLAIEKGGDLTEVTGVRDADAKYLSDLTSLCSKKATEFEARTKLRDEEIEAIGKAVDILGGTEVSSAQKHLPSLLEVRSGSFAQLRANTLTAPQLRAAAFLRDMSTRLSSHMLSTIALAAKADPLEKVKTLIEELIARLLQEATNEASHKGWCDKELSTNKQTRESKTAEVDTLTSNIEGLTSAVEIAKKDIAKTSKGITEIESSVAEYTSKRDSEKADNEAAIKEAKDGQKAIASAIKVLEEFYAKAAKDKSAASLVQGGLGEKQPATPEIFEGEVQSQASAKGGVIGMLEVVQSDFARLEADTKSAEDTAASEYDAFMSDSAVAKASLEEDIKHLKSEQLAKEGELTQAKESLVESQKTLDSALAYYEKLKPSCLDAGQTYDERKARRKEEIEALQEALRILSGDDIAALQEATD